MTKPRLKVIVPIATIIFVVWLPLFLGVPGALIPQTLWALLTGWVHFIGRTLPAVNWNGSALGFGVVLSLMAVGGLQWLGMSMTRDKAGRKWKLGWSLAIYGSVWMLFLTAMAVTGALHQTIWLASSKEPFGVYRSGMSPINLKKQAQVELELLANDGETLANVKKELIESMGPRTVQTDYTFHDLYSIAFFGEASSTNWAALIVPKASAKWDKKIAVVGRGEPWEEVDFENLEKLVAELEARFGSAPAAAR